MRGGRVAGIRTTPDIPVNLPHERSRPSHAAWPRHVAILVFLAFAAGFLFFFVDDEAIPLVYAQNVLHHKGLRYNSFEGLVEGYSDFLHVWLGVALIALTRALGLSKLAIFLAGKALSLLAGTATIVLTDRVLRRWPGVGNESRLASLLFLALAGPLAVWSCSSLETAAFTAILLVLLYALFAAPDSNDDATAGLALACVACVLAFLERIDGFLHAGVLIAAALAIASPARRRAIARRVVLPAMLAFVAYHAWRRWYFGSWLPTPVVAKILYKLTAHGPLVTKPPAAPYAIAFLGAMMWISPIVALAGGAIVAWRRRDRRLAALTIATLVMGGYVAFVGDWMFGFRFFVPLLPWLAVLLGIVLATLLERLSRAMGRITIAAIVLCAIVSAVRFERSYERVEDETNFLLHPSFEPSRYFTPFYSLYEMVRPEVKAGDRIAFNQAGFLPFMLDLDNLDDLGVCSRFVADLPTTDVQFTQVGRYSPLTNGPAIRAAHAYLLYLEPRLLITRGDLIRAANGGHAPEFLLQNRYRAVHYEPDGDNVVYVRTDVPVAPFQTDARAFSENLAHVSSIRHAWLQHERVPVASYLEQLPYLADRSTLITFQDRYSIDLTFDTTDTEVDALHIAYLLSTAPVTLHVQLRQHDGHAVFSDEMQLAANTGTSYHHVMRAPAPGMALSLQFTGPPGVPIHLTLHDLRLQGQRPALARHVARFLPLPSPDRVGTH
jgi:hypothetical protein